MKRVVTVSLNAQSFNFDEDAYDVLRGYLKRAESQLLNDPGRAEVLADLERSIAEKCAKFLHPQKDVVSLAEIHAVITEIGVVDAKVPGWEEANASPDPASPTGAKQLHQVREGAMISGVCNGIAAYFGMDVIIVRVVAIILGIASSGALVLIYGVLMFLVPYDTNVEKLNDQSVPGFMFKFVTHTKRKLAGSA